MKKLFYLRGFKIQWMIRKGFWILILLAIKCKLFGYAIYLLPNQDNEAFSIGTTEPIPELWNNGATVSLEGWVLGECVLYYETSNTKP